MEIKTKHYIIAFLLIVAVVATIWITRSDTNVEECCDAICGQFNQECVGMKDDMISCSYNYGQYGYEDYNEIFTFKLEQSAADLCKPILEAKDLALNETFEFEEETANGTVN